MEDGARETLPCDPHPLHALKTKVDQLCRAAGHFDNLAKPARELRLGMQLVLARPDADPLNAAPRAMGIFVRVTELELAVAEAARVIQTKAGVPRKSREDATQAARQGRALPLPVAVFMAAGEREHVSASNNACEICGGACNPSAAISLYVCTQCGATRRLPPNLDTSSSYGNYDETETAAAPRSNENSYHKNAMGYLRQLQGNEKCAITEAQGAALKYCGRRARAGGRNFSVEWARGVLQELKLTKYNDQIPTLARTHFGVDVPQLSDEEEQTLAARIENDIVDYLEMKQETEPTGRRRNALPCAYLAYRHIDRMFAPGEPRRMLLRLIHLQERPTFETYETAYWQICQRRGDPYYTPAPPPVSPFDVQL
jgi:hypothetical protein